MDNYANMSEKAMAPHSSTLAWKNPMDGGAWWATVHGVAESRTRLSDFTFTFHSYALEKEMATHSSVLALRSPGTREPGGLPSMGSHRVGHDWSDLAAAAACKYVSFWHGWVSHPGMPDMGEVLRKRDDLGHVTDIHSISPTTPSQLYTQGTEERIPDTFSLNHCLKTLCLGTKIWNSQL